MRGVATLILSAALTLACPVHSWAARLSSESSLEGGVLLGQPDDQAHPFEFSSVGVGLHPCAQTEELARTRIKQFFSTAYQPEFPPSEVEWRVKKGLPAAVVNLEYSSRSIDKANITRFPLYFKVKFLNDPDKISEEDRGRLPFIRTWYVLNCESVEYLYTNFGRPADAETPYPYDDLSQEHVSSRKSSEVRSEYKGKKYIERPGRVYQWVKAGYLDSLKLAKLKKSAVTTMTGFEEFVDFLYKIQYIYLRAPNASGRIVQRTKDEKKDGAFVITDTISWDTYNDAAPGGRTASIIHMAFTLDKKTGEVELSGTSQ